MILADAKTMQKIDEYAINILGIPSLHLMENAATSVKDFVLKINAKKIAVVCGIGNNGGDGVAVARLLKQTGLDVKCFYVGDKEKFSNDLKANVKRLSEQNLKLHKFDIHDYFFKECDLIIDAIFGVGLQREVYNEFKQAIDFINSLSCKKLSCDVPSGIDASTGEKLGVAVKADYTVTFSLNKIGLTKSDGKTYAGKVIVTDIGIPDEAIKKFI